MLLEKAMAKFMVGAGYELGSCKFILGVVCGRSLPPHMGTVTLGCDDGKDQGKRLYLVGCNPFGATKKKRFYDVEGGGKGLVRGEALLAGVLRKRKHGGMSHAGCGYPLHKMADLEPAPYNPAAVPLQGGSYAALDGNLMIKALEILTGG